MLFHFTTVSPRNHTFLETPIFSFPCHCPSHIFASETFELVVRRASAAARPHGGGARRRGLLCPVQMASVAPATPIAPTSADAASRTSQEIQLVPARKFKPMPKRRNCATLKKRPFIQVNKNPTLQKCEHVPSVVKHRQIVFPPAPSRQTPGAALDLRCGNYPHPVPRATTKCPTSLYVRQTPVPRTMQRGQNTAKF